MILTARRQGRAGDVSSFMDVFNLIHIDMKKILFLFFATILAGQVWAVNFDFKSGKLYYKIIDQNTVQLVVNDTYKELVSVIIPETVTYKKKNYTVVGIADSAFSKCVKLQSVSIPVSVKKVGNKAFIECVSLEKAEFASIEGLCQIEFKQKSSNPLSYANHLYINGKEIINLIIPDGVTSICNGAFGGCSSITSVTIPESVTSIGMEAFNDCRGLKKAEFSSIESLCKIKFNVYETRRSCNPLFYAHHLYIKGKEITDLIIPKGVKSIGDIAFCGCSNITTVTIPESVTNIGYGAFEGCSSLTSVTIPESVTSISDGAFYGCKNLMSITIPNSISKIGSAAFYECVSLTDVTIPNSVKEIGKKAFASCFHLTQVKIPASVKIIEEDAFSGCPRLKNVYCDVEKKPVGWDPYWIADKLSSKTFTRYEIIKWKGAVESYSSEIDDLSESSNMFLVGRFGKRSVRISDGGYLFISLYDDFEYMSGTYLRIDGKDYASFEKNMAIVNEKFAKWTQTAINDGVRNFRKTIVDFGDRIVYLAWFKPQEYTKLYAVFEVDEKGECLLKLGSKEIDDSKYAYSNYAPYYTFYSPEDFGKLYEIIKYDNAMKNYEIMKSKIDAKKKAIEDRDAKFD